MSSISFNGRSFGNLGVDMLAPSLKRFYFTLLFFVKKIDDLMFFLVISNSGPVYFAVNTYFFTFPVHLHRRHYWCSRNKVV